MLQEPLKYHHSTVVCFVAVDLVRICCLYEQIPSVESEGMQDRI